ncbi:MAG: AAA family ATPase [Actinomycetaceae bacterium]|nr:AAA family ATPase [Actinomycetaceae bacterium]MDU0970518.1 AAA family ATPase [Actinomycetaceae bacterium]
MGTDRKDRVPSCVVVIGSAGSGKSTIAREIARQVGGAYLDKDSVANVFTGALLAAHGEDPSVRDGSAYYTEVVRPLEYETLLNVGTDNLRLGRSVIFDAPFGAYFAQADYIEKRRAELRWPEDVKVVVVRVSASAEATRRRLEKRGLARDEWKLAHWDEFWRTIGSQAPTWRGVEIIECRNDEDGQAAQVAARALDQIVHG